MTKNTLAFTHFNILSQEQYETQSEPSKNELWAVATENYSDEDGNWYRVEPDGWCQQGGSLGAAYTAYTTKTFTFLKPFRDKHYFTTVQCSHTDDLRYPTITAKTPTAVTFINTYNRDGLGSWYACGYVK